MIWGLAQRSLCCIVHATCARECVGEEGGILAERRPPWFSSISQEHGLLPRHGSRPQRRHPCPGHEVPLLRHSAPGQPHARSGWLMAVFSRFHWRPAGSTVRADWMMVVVGR